MKMEHMKESEKSLMERLNNAIEFRPVDRVPCAPMIEYYAARFSHISNYDFLFDHKSAFDAFHRIKEEYPIWDIRRSTYFVHYGPCQNTVGLLKSRIPGLNAEAENELQFLEYEAMTRQDYKIILDKGYDEYLLAVYRTLYGVGREEVHEARALMTDIQKREIEDARDNQQVFLYGDHLCFPASYFSNLRSFEQFIRDVYQIPDLLKEVLDIATDQSLDMIISNVKNTGINRVMIGINRICGEFFSNAIFEDLFWPYLEKCARTLINNDIIPILHLDGNWNNNLEYFRTLPKHKVIIELDGKTDIFKAREVLDNHSCILGDVPGQLFTIGKPEQVKAYCSKLLSVFGKSGGFILGSGCTLPYTSRHENVAAFFHAVEEYM